MHPLPFPYANYFLKGIELPEATQNNVLDLLVRDTATKAKAIELLRLPKDSLVALKTVVSDKQLLSVSDLITSAVGQ